MSVFNNRLLCMAATALLASCATQPDPERTARETAVQDLIEVRGLPETNAIRSSDRDHWDEITISYVLYHGRNTDYLVQFYRPCYDLTDTSRIIPDVRRDSTRIRAREDTLRGCRIEKLYLLTPAESAELEQIGKAPLPAS